MLIRLIDGIDLAADSLTKRLAERFEQSLGMNLFVSVACEPVDARHLSKAEALKLSQLQTNKRRREWLTGRAALKSMLRALGEDSDSERLRFPHHRYSLSHTGSLAIAVAALGRSLSGIGIDVELHRQVNKRAARFFLGPDELEWLRAVESQKLDATLLRLWTVKEAIYKSDCHNEQSLVGYYRVTDPSCLDGVAYSTRRWTAGKRFQYATVPVDTDGKAGFVSISISS